MPDVFVSPEEQQPPSRFARTAPVAPNEEQSEQQAPSPILSDNDNQQPIPPSHHQQVPLLTAFWENPQGISFESQETGETIVLFLRRHFITNLLWILGSLGLCLLPLIGVYAQKIGYTFTLLPPVFITVIVLIYYLFVLTYAFTRFLNWFYNITLVTQKRILDIEMEDLTYKKISATEISHVQDVSYTQDSIFMPMFDYGKVLIQTAGTIENFQVDNVHKPEIVVKMVENLAGTSERGAIHEP